MELLVSRSFCPSRDRGGLGQEQTVDIWGGQSKNTKGKEMSGFSEGMMTLVIALYITSSDKSCLVLYEYVWFKQSRIFIFLWSLLSYYETEYM